MYFLDFANLIDINENLYLNKFQHILEDLAKKYSGVSLMDEPTARFTTVREHMIEDGKAKRLQNCSEESIANAA